MLHHTYYQKTGVFMLASNNIVPAAAFNGYAGNGKGLNNPEAEQQIRVGPLHCGFYDIGEPYDHPRLGPSVMALTAWRPLWGRSAFRIHGDNGKGDKSASEGCIVLNRMQRDMIANSGVRILAVVHG
jgi:hypothetical protein